MTKFTFFFFEALFYQNKNPLISEGGHYSTKGSKAFKREIYYQQALLLVD